MAETKESTVLNITSEDAMSMFDKLSRLSTNRRIEPLNQFDYVEYDHRYAYDPFNLLIGDSWFMIPPEMIMVSSESNANTVTTLRQENRMKTKNGYHNRIIQISMVFNGYDEINGFKVKGPVHDDGNGVYTDICYVDGLRQLLAQFKYTPFLPISNEFINLTYGIFTVALQAINIFTVEGFPDMLQCSIILQEAEMFPYIEQPSVALQYMIDWDLYRYHIQSFMTEVHEYRKLQSLPTNHNHKAFRMSILDPVYLNDDTWLVKNSKNLIADVFTDDSKYIECIDSSEKDVYITNFHTGYQNILTNIQMAAMPSPCLQFIGGMDTIYSITMETTDIEVVQLIEMTQIRNDLAIRNNPHYRGACGFVKLQCDLVEFTGSLFVMIDSVETKTVPGLPNLYNITLNCISYDIINTKRESLDGFMPFDYEKGEEIDLSASTFNDLENADQDTTIDDIKQQKNYHFIDQNDYGWSIKTSQDNYAEYKIKSTIELYPDLRLPTYYEINQAIAAIKDFRVKNDLTPLPYDSYPIQPVCMLTGVNPNGSYPDITTQTHEADVDIEWGDIVAPIAGGAVVGGAIGSIVPGVGTLIGIVAGSVIGGAEGAFLFITSEMAGNDSVDDTGDLIAYLEGDYINSAVYLGYVDPDFYVFYPNTYEDYANDEYVNSTLVNPHDTTPSSHESSKTDNPDYTNNGQEINDKAEAFVALAKNYIGSSYLFGSEGEKNDGNKQSFDSSGFITFLLKRMGVMPSNAKPLSPEEIMNSDIFYEVKWDKKKRGDILINDNQDHACIYAGKDKYKRDTVIHAKNAKEGVTEEEIPSSMCYAFRVVAFVDDEVQGTSSSRPYEDNEAKWPSLDEPQDDTSNKYSLEEAEINTESNQAAWNSIKAKDSLSDYAIAGIMGFAQSSGLNASAVWNEIKNDETVVNSLKNARTAEEAAAIIARKAANATDESIFSGISANINRAEASATSFYNVFSVEAQQGDISSLTAPITRKDNTNEELYSVKVEREDNGGGNNITYDEYDSICRAVATECQGEPLNSKVAMAQLIYDRLTFEDKLFGGITNILSDRRQFKQPLNDIDEIDMSDAQSAVTSVFSGGKRWRKQQTLLYFSTDDVLDSGYDFEENRWTKIGTVGTHCYFGRAFPSQTKKYTISGNGVSDASNNAYTEKTNNVRNVVNANLSRFGNPILFKAKMSSRDTTYGNAYEEVVNTYENQFNTSFVNERQYSGRGRLVRAFPTFLFLIMDEGGGWYDGRKLWTNYYIYKSVVSISNHIANDSAASFCHIVVTNAYHTLDKTQEGLGNYSVENDSAYGDLTKNFYKTFGCLPGGIKITKTLAELHTIIYDHARLREDARMHVRMGYGSDPFSLAPVITGACCGIEIGENIEIVIASDGHELTQEIMSSKEKDTNNGFFGLGMIQEPSDLIADALTKRASFINSLGIKIFNIDTDKYFEESKYHIEHFGLYMRQDNYNENRTELLEGDSDEQAKAIKNDFWYYDWYFRFSPHFDIGIKNQYDLLKNIYRGNYLHQCYSYPLKNAAKAIIGWDKEKNLVFSKYNMTPWDMMQLCAQSVPEFVCYPIFHQFEHRVYYGMPHWMTKYRYSYTSKGIYEECKTKAQTHFIDSCFNIIDNRTAVSSKNSHTNVKVMYIRGSTPTSTGILHSDVTIESCKQSTVILDTPIAQTDTNAFLEVCQYRKGREMARNVGVSDLLMSWEKEYQGELLIIGNPGIMPDDYIMINDMYTSLFGIAKVREVVNTFNVNMGYTTTIDNADTASVGSNTTHAIS